jgi:adenine-specific DNA-methyltransferase
MSRAKQLGQFFTPEPVAKALVRWAVRSAADRILDPSCGDGEFLSAHEHAVGIELDPQHAAAARLRAPAALVHEADFFAWADETHERFEAIVGNPPFIRYQGFSGHVRARALRQAARFGATLPELTSSWAPFIAAASLLLKPGGRIAFVVPAEIGHASYAVPLLEALCARFGVVRITAIREKLFPGLSEDAWLLQANEYGGATSGIEFAVVETFEPSARPHARLVSLGALREARGRLRRWLLPQGVLETYRELENGDGVVRLGSIADVGIGYVSGANDFFHLRPSVAKRLGIPNRFLRPAVRRGGSLPASPALTKDHVREWVANDDAVLLLQIARDHRALPHGVTSYLNSTAGDDAREAYKCRVRDPWYSVPDVTVPDGFLTYMSGERVQVVENAARCVATNSVHVVHMKDRSAFRSLRAAFESPLTKLSCEVEGHPLGGGMLKVEPREAQRVLIARRSSATAVRAASDMLQEGIARMRRWRGYA